MSKQFAHRGVQIDLGRVIERPETVERLLPIYASLGYNVLQLYLENAFVFASHPKLARPFAWTTEQVMRVVEAATSYGISVIPAIQSMGHCAWVGSHPDYAELDERFEEGDDVSGVLCPCHPRTLPMLEGMIQDVAPLATSGIIHLGLDEVFSIGVCSRCKPLREKIGEGGIFIEHVNRVTEFARGVGKRPAIWGDMFYYHPDKVAQLAKDVLIQDWYYYTFENTPRVELFGFPEMDTQALWREHGLEAWGCPSSFYTAIMPTSLPDETIENARSWARYLDGKTGTGMMVTQWELSPASIDMCLPVEAAIVSLLQGSTASNAELLVEACAFLYDRPQFAPLLDELGAHRLHGHCDLAWLRAPSLSAMIAFSDTARDASIATRMDKIAQEIEDLAHGAAHREMVRAFVPPARWLAYQYRKRAWVEECAALVARLEYSRACEKLARLQQEADSIGAAYQEEWNRNRYEDEASAIPARMKLEAAMFGEEVEALQSAMRGGEYSGNFTSVSIGVHIVNTNPAIPIFALSTSPDGIDFIQRGKGTVLLFDSRAAQPTASDQLCYSFSIEKPEDARFIKITAIGAGQFALRGISMKRGNEEWRVQNVRSEGLVQNAENILRGECAQAGCAEPRALYYKQMEAGDSGRVFQVEHGSLTATFDIS